MGEISMSGSTREREAAVIGLGAFHPVLSSLPYWLKSGVQKPQMNTNEHETYRQKDLQFRSFSVVHGR